DILRLETHIFSSAENARAQSLKDQVELRRYLRAQQEFLDNESHHLNLIVEVVLSILGHIIQALPKAEGAPGLMMVPLIDLLSTPAANLVERINATLFSDDLIEVNLFNRLRDVIYVNACRASGILPFEETKKEVVPPTKSNLPGIEVITAYHYNTPWA